MPPHLQEAVITAEGMVAGVQNASCFILYLTHDVLTRVYCLLEIWTAMQAGKFIVILAESENRFHPWSYVHWKNDEVFNKDTWQWEPVGGAASTQRWTKVRFQDGCDAWVNVATGAARFTDPANASPSPPQPSTGNTNPEP